MMEQIIERKIQEVVQRKAHTPLSSLMASRLYQRQPLSLTAALRMHDPSIVALFRRKESGRKIHCAESLEALTRFYTAYGASAICIHTDAVMGGGSLDDLLHARDNDLPLIREDWIVDAYQVHEAKAFGADALILHSSLVSSEQLNKLCDLCFDLCIEPLLMLDEDRAVKSFPRKIRVVYIHLRNRKGTFYQDALKARHKGQLFLAGELCSATEARTILNMGYDAVVMGSVFIRDADPGRAFKEFMYTF